jgi:intracellular sulfur oxidation DsrE/DsrF family protein
MKLTEISGLFAMTKYRAVFHLTEIEKANLALNNVRNLLAELGEDLAEVELVTNSEGVKALLKTGPYGEKVDELAKKGVRFVLCSKSLRAMRLERGEFFDLAEVVPSGTGELVKRQTEGWAYVRP